MVKPFSVKRSADGIPSMTYQVDGDRFVIERGGEVLRGRYVGSTRFEWQMNGKKVGVEEWIARYKEWSSDFEIGDMLAISAVYESALKDGNIRGAAAGWRVGAELGHASAIYELGICLRDGELGRKDPQGAFQLFQQGADMGNGGCLRELALCYEKGIGCARDEKKYLELIDRAGELGDLLAVAGEVKRLQEADDPKWIPFAKRVVEIGLKKGVKKDRYVSDPNVAKSQEEKETWWLRTVARALGTAYICGQGVEKDDAEAFKYFQIASDYCDPIGANEAGVCALNGEGRPADRQEALQYFLRSAKLGYAPAMWRYATTTLTRNERATFADRNGNRRDYPMVAFSEPTRGQTNQNRLRQVVDVAQRGSRAEREGYFAD